MVVIVHGFNPAIAGLDGITTGEALGSEQFIPIRFAVGKSVLQVKVTVAKQASTISTRETFGMKLFANSVQAVSFDAFLTPRADGGQVILEASFTVERFLLLDESHVGQGASALVHGAHEVVGTPRQTQSRHELATNLYVA